MRIIQPHELDAIKKVLGGIPYTFHRAEGFYPLMLESDESAKANGECNPGTLRVVNELTKDVVFEGAGR